MDSESEGYEATKYEIQMIMVLDIAIMCLRNML
jgi:hypothetical protein